MTALGSYFKNKREEEGISIDQVAEETNIASRYLKAIEEQDFDQFPADVYAKGFIRSYAEYLDLDAQALVMEYSLNFEESDNEQNNTRNKNNFLYWVFLVFLIGLGASMIILRFAWFYPRKKATLSKRSSSATPAEIVKSDREVINLRKSASELKLEVISTRKTWVYAVFDGMRKKEFMFQPGDRKSWTAEDTIRLWMGDAGALRFYLNDRVLPLLGPKGKAMDRLITLDDNKLIIKTPGK